MLVAEVFLDVKEVFQSRLEPGLIEIVELRSIVFWYEWSEPMVKDPPLLSN